MKNPANDYRLLEERTLLEALQLSLHENHFITELWESQDEDWWSLSVGPYEVCVDTETMIYTIIDFDEEVFKTTLPHRIVKWFNKKWES